MYVISYNLMYEFVTLPGYFICISVYKYSLFFITLLPLGTTLPSVHFHVPSEAASEPPSQNEWPEITAKRTFHYSLSFTITAYVSM